MFDTSMRYFISIFLGYRIMYLVTEFIGCVSICLDTLPAQKNDCVVESVLNLPQTMKRLIRSYGLQASTK